LTALDGPQAEVEALRQERQRLAEENAELKRGERRAVKGYRREKQLRPYQAELIKMQQRLELSTRQRTCLAHRAARAYRAWQEAQERLQATRDQAQHWQGQVRVYKALYQARGRTERPHSRLAQARRSWTFDNADCLDVSRI
jgi:hypothetical protein